MRKKKKAQGNVLKAAAGIFAYISEHPEKPQAKRVDAILQLLQAIKKEKRAYEKGELCNNLRESFNRYRWIREIIFFTDGPGEMVTAAKPLTEDDSWEYGSIGILLTIAEYYPDRLSSIRRCDGCPRWILAAKSDHRFCSGTCRQRDYDNDPERQEQHRANMRRLYQLEKQREERSKRVVGFTKGSKGRSQNRRKPLH